MASVLLAHLPNLSLHNCVNMHKNTVSTFTNSTWRMLPWYLAQAAPRGTVDDPSSMSSTTQPYCERSAHTVHFLGMTSSNAAIWLLKLPQHNRSTPQPGVPHPLQCAMYVCMYVLHTFLPVTPCTMMRSSPRSTWRSAAYRTKDLPGPEHTHKIPDWPQYRAMEQLYIQTKCYRPSPAQLCRSLSVGKNCCSFARAWVCTLSTVGTLSAYLLITAQ